MKFYLGIHQPQWMTKTTVPLFVSRRRLVGYKKLHRAAGRWALDSGAFTEVSTFGKWTVTASDYANEVRRFVAEIGGMDWAAIQDYMCEPFILAKTGMTVRTHQWLTVGSLLKLRDIAPEIPWAPVLQGWEPDDYLRHRDMYEQAGVNLSLEPVVGIGSVCRRGSSEEIRIIAQRNSDLRLHGFGVKMRGVEVAAQYFKSTDSMAWSFEARRKPPLPGHGERHKNCANCLEYGLMWRDRLVARLAAAGAELEAA